MFTINIRAGRVQIRSDANTVLQTAVSFAKKKKRKLDGEGSMVLHSQTVT